MIIKLIAVIRDTGLTSVQIESDDPIIENELEEIHKEDPQFLADCISNCITGILERHREEKAEKSQLKPPDNINPGLN